MDFFWADTHFGHQRIIQHCYRQYPDVYAMDEALIGAWNAVVTARDTVWVLGDFSYTITDVSEYLSALRGKIKLVPGGHDYKWLAKLPEYPDKTKVTVYPPIVDVRINDTYLVLCHYPMRSWERSHHGSIHLHGHTHGGSNYYKGSLDVGVDVQPFPVTLEQVIQQIRDAEYERLNEE